MNDVTEMGEAPLGKLLLKFSIPAIAVMVVNGLYNFIDRVFIGQGMGTDALAAVSAGFPMMIIAGAVGLLFSVGSSTLISIAMGAGKREEAESILGQGFAASLLAAIAVSIFGWIFMDPMLKAFGTTARIMPMAREYLGVVMIGFIFQIPTMAIGNSLRSQNRPRTTVISTVSGTVLNAILAPLFIFALKWGITGAALATVIAQGFSALLTVWFIQDRKSILKIRRKNLNPKAETMRSMLKLGIPVSLVQLLSLVMLVVANNAMARLGGETALAVIGIINAMMMLMMFPVMGIVQGAQTLWGFNYGAGKLDRVKRLTRMTLFWTTALSVAFTVVTEVFARSFVSAFNSADPALISLGSHGISIFMLSFFMVGVEFTASQFFMSIGQAGKGGTLYLARNVFSILGMAILPLFLGIDGVFWAGPLNDLISTALSVVMLAVGMKTLAVKADPAGAVTEETGGAAPEAISEPIAEGEAV
jgi:putative MATE family efflux protein